MINETSGKYFKNLKGFKKGLHDFFGYLKKGMPSLMVPLLENEERFKNMIDQCSREKNSKLTNKCMSPKTFMLQKYV